MQKPVDLMLSQAKVGVCVQNPVDLIILEASVGVCVQKTVELQFFRKFLKLFKLVVNKSKNHFRPIFSPLRVVANNFDFLKFRQKNPPPHNFFVPPQKIQSCSK